MKKEVFLRDRHLVGRDIHLEPYIHTSQVVVILGVRRCGKSSLLFLLKEKMKLSEGDFCYFNFDDERIMRKVEVLEQIDNLHSELYNKEAILFFDEIQNIPGWEKFVNRIYEQERKVFVTGSNASLLSSEISTSLTGRNKPLNLFPFSFNEYLRFKQLSFDVHFISTKDKIRITGELNP
ncbi:MAG TPA: hypothetical protein ENI76_08125 [Ignavibacteria bacterium]|nr:hypothetical protein [Ignavibacteria bacterium]